ncbi:MAG: HDOD domain-containing protein [Deltaproteobacteria bacterium]|nr:HDOD domain-containing protein [Deltaproteobacteria bacterium]
MPPFSAAARPPPAPAQTVDRDAAPTIDLLAFADYPPQARCVPDEAQAEKATWLSAVITERVHADQYELPAFPALAVRVLNIMQQPEPDMAELVRTIHADAAISAQLLRMANSAFYSRGVEVSTVRDAAVRLGMKAVSNVAVAAATRAMLDAQEREYRDTFPEQFKRLASYSVQCAASSRWLALWLHQADQEQAFLGGLLHDIGKLVALRALAGMVQDGDAAPDLPAVVVGAALEECHVALGSELAFFWSLPGYVGHVCQQHHQPKPEAAPTNRVLHLIRIASALYESRTDPLHRRSLPDELAWSAQAIGLATEPLEAIAGELKRLGGASPNL